MAGEDHAENNPKISPQMDQYGDAARALIRTRTAATAAAFFLGHLKPGMNLLDCGCGEGTITVDLAETLRPGTVIGVDLAPGAIERAQHLATERGVANMRFEEGTVYALPFPDASFDAVFSHALFEHLTDKSKALREIWRVLKPGGIVGLRSSDLGIMVIEPADPLIDQFWALVARIRNELGGESNVGRRLCTLLQQAKFTHVQGSASFENYGTAERLRWCGEVHSRATLDSNYTTEWLARGWVERDLLEHMSTAWRTWAAQPGAFAAMGWCEAVGWKQSAG
jgi:ubiquinone/menaquinone biosynthesis C-methylase UbiE